MIQLTLGEIAEIVGGRLCGGACPEDIVTGSVEFDSRKLTAGSLFLCLPGARVDGHDFAAAAIDAGAVAVLAARDVGVPAIIVTPTGRASDTNAEALSHDDAQGSGAAVLEALTRLARAVAVELSTKHDLVIVGITGSAGKTSTKDMAAAVLGQRFNVVAPPGSFNNEIGHPYTVLRCDTTTDILVAEMSARNIGHIAHLATIAPPRIGAVLNVGSAHVGEFGSKEAIAQAKGELVESLGPEGTAVLNADDPFVAAMSERTRARVVTCSQTSAHASVRATGVHLDADGRACFVLHTPGDCASVALPVVGAHHVANALAVAGIAAELGMTAPEIAAGLHNYQLASAHRMAVTRRSDGITVIDDAYNANPESMRAGISAARACVAAGGRLFAVLGPMGELGDQSRRAHADLGTDAAALGVSTLVAVGDDEIMEAMSDAAAQAGINTRVVRNSVEALDYLAQSLAPGDCVIVKASNAVRLWEVAEALCSPDVKEEFEEQ